VLLDSREEAFVAIITSVSSETERIRKDALQHTSALGPVKICRFTSRAEKFGYDF